MSVVSTEPEDDNLTPEQQAALTDAKLETAKEQTKAAEAQQRSEELRAETRRLRFNDTLARAVNESGLKSFLPDKELLTMLNGEQGVRVEGNETGSELRCSLRGKPVTLLTLVEVFCKSHPTLFDRRSAAVRKLLGAESDGVVCKADLTDAAQKRIYISEFGLEAWEKLPLSKPRTRDVNSMTATDWSRLSYHQKSEIVAQHGSEIVSKILKRMEPKQ